MAHAICSQLSYFIKIINVKCEPQVKGSLGHNILLRKYFRGNLNETILANEIGSLRFPRKIFLTRTFIITLPSGIDV